MAIGKVLLAGFAALWALRMFRERQPRPWGPLRRGGGRGAILELAAGSGKAATLWAEQLAREGVKAEVVLTDLQPNPAVWRRLGAEAAAASAGSVRVSYESGSVDATQVPGHLPVVASLRMMHLSLHHFPPPLVRGILADVVRTGSALLVGDCAPSAQNLLMLNLVGAATQGPVLLHRPAQHALLMPLVGSHDGVVSVLRSYSPDDLRVLAEGLHGAERYEWRFFGSRSGLAMMLGSWADSLPADPLLQWNLFMPREDEGVLRTRFTGKAGTGTQGTTVYAAV